MIMMQWNEYKQTEDSTIRREFIKIFLLLQYSVEKENIILFSVLFRNSWVKRLKDEN